MSALGSHWPDEVDDEDELMEAVAAAYADREWTIEELHRLLDRGGRRRRGGRGKASRDAPLLLREFILACGTTGSGCELLRGDPFPHSDQVFFEVFSVGNGDYWVCTPGEASIARLVDHEEGYWPSEPIPLGTLLAAWLFHDELVARGLTDHCDADLHASDLCVVCPWSVFQQLDF